ncbi:5-oxoprolinase subunit PxpA [Psychroserpens ponticola]|uniref:5-oxoprolinase subunit PxpA n=1 Tax=Psychroserpens ponticola TaxID=2932268 RepID=A0ABY7RTI1_9FLAO|nr:5-oxoprolinase subunit PxpA [Psychroserpens ponticola]WCO00419.1 5-oxoprolinase subunit PxpA [Psychroserpens ponticola]
MKQIDINCDLGEGFGNEALLMPYLSSCNIACGGHAGTLETMRLVSKLAKKHHVKIGAHPSFPDEKNFGRQIIDMSVSDLHKALYEQIDSLVEVVKSIGLELHHVKPHGALYNLASIDKKTAQIIVSVIKSVDENLILYAPYRSMISKIAITDGLKVMYEGFADRNYNENLTLVSRENNDAIIRDSELIFEHVFKMISEGKVKMKNGVEVELKVDTFCVHGDHENVVNNLKNLIHKLKQNSIKIL